MKNQFKILFADRAIITLDQYERILQSLVTFADTVLLPAHIRFSNELPSEFHQHALRSLNELVEEKKITFWQYPGLIIPPESRGIITSAAIINEMDLDSYREFYESVNESARMKIRERGIYKSSDLQLRHSTTAVTYFRNTLWPLCLAQFFETDRLVYNPNEMSSLRSLVPSEKSADLEERVIRSFLNDQRLPRLSVLNARQIIKLSEQHTQFRVAVEKVTNKLSADSPNEEEVTGAVKLLFDEYLKDADELIRAQLSPKSAVIATVKNLVLTTISVVGVGILVPLVAVVPFLDTPLSWLQNKRKLSAVTAFTAKLRRELSKGEKEN